MGRAHFYCYQLCIIKGRQYLVYTWEGFPTLQIKPLLTRFVYLTFDSPDTGWSYMQGSSTLHLTLEEHNSLHLQMIVLTGSVLKELLSWWLEEVLTLKI